MSQGCPCTVNCKLNFYGMAGLGQRGPCMVESGGQEGLHCGEGAKGSLYGGNEAGPGPCIGTPYEQTHIHDWKHYFPTILLAGSNRNPIDSDVNNRRQVFRLFFRSHVARHMDHSIYLAMCCWQYRSWYLLEGIDIHSCPEISPTDKAVPDMSMITTQTWVSHFPFKNIPFYISYTSVL